MKCKQCNDVSTLTQRYSSVFKKTAVNSERVTHVRILHKTNSVRRTVVSQAIKNIFLLEKAYQNKTYVV